MVVIVNYNGYIDTEECLASLRKVLTPDMFVAIVDNGSTNDYAEKLNEFVIEKKRTPDLFGREFGLFWWQQCW